MDPLWQHFFFFNPLLNNSYYTLPERFILDSTKLKEFVEDNFKSYGTADNFPKRVENNVGKG